MDVWSTVGYTGVAVGLLVGMLLGNTALSLIDSPWKNNSLYATSLVESRGDAPDLYDIHLWPDGRDD